MAIKLLSWPTHRGAPLPALEGGWSSGDDADLVDVHDPATGQLIATVAGGGPDQVEAAAAQAAQVFQDDWRWRPARERGRLLMEAARLIRSHGDEIAALETWEMGKPYDQSRRFDVEFCADSFEFYGGLADKVPGRAFDLGPIIAQTYREPYGVVGGIIPFNWPPIHTAAKSAPALAAGNTVLLKPPEQCPLTIMRIVELLQTVFPPGVIGAVPGVGPRAGAALVSSRHVRKLSFTGSSATARHVLREAAANLTPTSTELGGKNALIVFADADLDSALEAALEGAFFNQGEACTAASRLLVEEPVLDEFVSRLGVAVARLRTGDGFDAGTHIGPMVTATQRDRVQSHLDEALADGATVVAQAPVPDSDALADGYWVAPTLLGPVESEMRIAREEVFGPVTAVLRFQTEEDAVRLANDSEFGLVASLFTRDAVRANRVARRLDVGMVMINNYNRAFLGSPFGGVKASGSGREHAIESINEFVYSKNVRSASGLAPVPRWDAIEVALSDV